MKPKIVIVDEDDQVIGHKEIDSLEGRDIYRVSALWITNRIKGEVLLAKRALSKSHDPGKWGPAVAGTVDEGETYDSNIVKEAEEELGLEGIRCEKGPKERVFGQYNYFIQWYLLESDKPLEEFKIRKDEVEEIKWFSKEYLKNEIRDNHAEFLDKMDRWIEIFCE